MTMVRQVERNVTAVGSRYVAALVNVMVNTQRHDLVLLDTGMVLIPNTRYRGLSKQRLVKTLRETPPERLATMPGHRFVPYDEIASVTRISAFRLHYNLTLYSGETVQLRIPLSAKQIGKATKTLLGILDHLTARCASVTVPPA